MGKERGSKYLDDNEEKAWEHFHSYFSTKDYKHVVVIESAAIVGLIVCLTGYRFIKLALFMTGFTLAFSAFYIFSPTIIRTKYCCNTRGREDVHIGISGLVGLLAGILLCRLYRVGVVLCGKCLGMLLALVLLQSPAGKYFQGNASVGSLFALMAITCGSLAVKYEKSLMVLATAFLGSYATICGVDLFVQTSFSFAVLDYLMYFKEALQISLKSDHHLQSLTLPHMKETRLMSSSGWRERSTDVIAISKLHESLLALIHRYSLHFLKEFYMISGRELTIPYGYLGTGSNSSISVLMWSTPKKAEDSSWAYPVVYPLPDS